VKPHGHEGRQPLGVDAEAHHERLAHEGVAAGRVGVGVGVAGALALVVGELSLGTLCFTIH
jgi:hypothetical protein